MPYLKNISDVVIEARPYKPGFVQDRLIAKRKSISLLWSLLTAATLSSGMTSFLLNSWMIVLFSFFFNLSAFWTCHPSASTPRWKEKGSTTLSLPPFTIPGTLLNILTSSFSSTLWSCRAAASYSTSWSSVSSSSSSFASSSSSAASAPTKRDKRGQEKIASVCYFIGLW